MNSKLLTVETLEYDGLTAPSSTTENPRLVAAVRQALCRTGYASLKKLRVSAWHSAVVISGSVPSYHLKQMAQAVVLALPDVHALRNEIAVPAAAR
ncbi:MAG TPA: BON domain-containing protein [Planctomycetaceae bacterium]|jgi:hypothetical protein